MSAFSESKLPTSFINEVESFSQNLIVVRSSITNLEECVNWVKEYGKLTNTKWNSRTSKPCSERFVCSKRFVCHQSAFMKVTPEVNRRRFSKNSNCMATINIKVKLNTSNTRKKDPFVKKGLFAVVTINDTHNHSLNTAQALKFLPSSDCKEKFLQYFKDGMGITEASKYHQEILQLEDDFAEDDLTNSRLNPPYRVVQYWYNQWQFENLGPRIGQGRIKSSATVVKEVEDHSPIEPTAQIKEEPTDDYPNPSTSNDTANEEFILPHVDNSWTTPDSLVEPQFTLSVASLGSANEPEASADEHLKKKQRTNPSEMSTLVSAPNGTEVRPQSPVRNFEEISNPDSSNEHHKDQFHVFGMYVATKLRSFDPISSAFAQKAIGDIILQAEMGKYIRSDTEYKVLNCAS